MAKRRNQIASESLTASQALGKVIIGGLIATAGAFAFFLLRDTYDWLMKPSTEDQNANLSG